MPTFTVLVTEVRHVPCQYTVEADTPEEALELAGRGETTGEAENLAKAEVVDRHVRRDSLAEAPLEDRVNAKIQGVARALADMARKPR